MSFLMFWPFFFFFFPQAFFCTFALVEPDAERCPAWFHRPSDDPWPHPYWCTLAPFQSLLLTVQPAADDQKDCHAASSLVPATPLSRLHAPEGRSGMFQVFASALFRDGVEELSQCSRPGDDKREEEEDDEDWILVNYLSKSSTKQNQWLESATYW